MPNVVRMALSQAVNAYPAMPTTLEELPRLAGHLDEVRQANLDHNAALIRRAADAGAKIAQLGEHRAPPHARLDAQARRDLRVERRLVGLERAAELAPQVPVQPDLAPQSALELGDRVRREVRLLLLLVVLEGGVGV